MLRISVHRVDTHQGRRTGIITRAVPRCGVEDCWLLLNRQGARLLDVRSAAALDAMKLTKPPRVTTHVDIASTEPAAFADTVRRAGLLPSVSIVIGSADGLEDSDAAAQALEAAGYSNIVIMEGGMTAFFDVYSTSGRKKPPKGRWVPTGAEALKSGLNIAGAAESYTEGGDLTVSRWTVDPKTNTVNYEEYVAEPRTGES